MAYSTKLSLPELKIWVDNYVDLMKISNSSFIATANNVVGLLDKVGKIFTLDTSFTQDKLAQFEGEYLSFGKTIEEWYEDLILPTDYDSTGAGALTPDDPTYRPVYYSYTLGRPKFKTTIRNNNVERAVHNEGQLGEIVSMQFKRLDDSMAQYRYAVKREMIAKFIELAEGEMTSTTAFATNTAYAVNTLLTSNNEHGIVVKPIASGSGLTWDTAKSGGYIIVLDLIEEINRPTDTATGEAFIKALKKDVEIASDVSEGHSLNGNTLGVVGELVILVKQGILPELEVETFAGAFNRGDVALPARVITVKDFGSANDDYFAVVMDSRAMRLHNTYNATRENFNGDGDFLNVFRHTEDSAFISRNCFFKAYKVGA